VVATHLERIRDLMSHFVGVVRTDAGLAIAVRELGAIVDAVETLVADYRVDSGLAELRGAATVALVVARAAAERHESRGVHFNRDWPDASEDAHESFSTAGRSG
jgi:L-aspartate oxidase